jgi:ribosomal-protein-alanine acetyltransferase
VSLRDAAPADLDQLIEIERESFSADRLSRRSIRRLMSSRTAAVRVVTAGRRLAGYHLVLFRTGSAVARLYSIAVHRGHRGRGVGERLLADAERVSAGRGARALRLEVRPDNAAAIGLYRRAGYRLAGRRPNYYADNADALRYEKPLGAAGRLRAAADRDRRSRAADASPASMRPRRSPGASAAEE